MKEGIEFLSERAKEFWDRAYEDFEKRRYNLCVLGFEQAIQLWLKYLIGLKAGDFPKTHYLTDLIGDVIELYKSKNLKKFYTENILAIKGLEDAYITSRYFPKKFTKEEADGTIALSLKFIKFIEDETKHKFI